MEKRYQLISSFIVLVLGLLLCLPLAANAQSDSELTIRGTIRVGRDVIPDVTVLVTDSQNVEIGTATTAEDGKWEIGNAKDYIYHKTVYDIKSLTSLLTEVGYKDIRPWSWNEILPEEYDDHSKAYYPHMDFENGIHVSLNIECSK